MFSPEFYYSVVGFMAVMAVMVFIALHRLTAGYGMMYNSKWGPSIGNRAGWIIMESPAFIAMLLFWLLSPRRLEPALIVMTSIFLIHYFQRSFIFPFLIRGKNKMPWAIILMGAVFNVINTYMIGGWFFYVSPENAYPVSWLGSPLFILGTVVFLIGMAINLQSDYIIRHLRKPGDTRHYLPQKGMYRYVTSANYLGEIIEWAGWAILTCSLSGLVFFWWTVANLVPRANAIWHRYREEFGSEVGERKRVFPFIY